MHGFGHPTTGIDHVLAMIAVGVLGSQLGGRALWLVPMGFLVVMAVAGTFGMAGLQMPLAELGIAFSVVVLGLAIAFPPKLPALAAAALVGFFGLFHGYVHGAEMPATVSALPYAAGFLGATTLLHGFGVGLGLLSRRAASTLGCDVVQAGGGSMALVGAAILMKIL